MMIYKKIFYRLNYLLLFNVSIKRYITVFTISFIISFIIGYSINYSLYTNKVNEKKITINKLNIITDSLYLINKQYETDLLSYNKIVEDKDYLRYIAFKYSNITVPKNINTNDLKLINRLCEEYKIPQKYIWRLINKESRFNKTAKSRAGAYGYMQITPSTYKKLYYLYTTNVGPLDNYTSEQINLILGHYYLYRLYSKYKDWNLTFAAYNAGPGNVNNNIPNIAETKNYVNYITK